MAKLDGEEPWPDCPSGTATGEVMMLGRSGDSCGW